MKWAGVMAAIIATGILSRIAHTGFVVIDKYLGDALYAAMVYWLLRLFAGCRVSAVEAGILMTGIELFQLTMIPARMLASEQLAVRLCARLIGVEFSVLDLLAYGVGIGCLWLSDAAISPRRSRTPLL